jgi:hypothetical protein
MSQTIDVTGLSPEAIRQVQQLVDEIRSKPPAPPRAAEPAKMPFWTGPVPSQDSPEWIDWLRAWSESHPKRVVEIDDDRGSIYDRDTP